MEQWLYHWLHIRWKPPNIISVYYYTQTHFPAHFCHMQHKVCRQTRQCNLPLKPRKAQSRAVQAAVRAMNAKLYATKPVKRPTASTWTPTVASSSHIYLLNPRAGGGGRNLQYIYVLCWDTTTFDRFFYWFILILPTMWTYLWLEKVKTKPPFSTNI